MWIDFLRTKIPILCRMPRSSAHCRASCDARHIFFALLEQKSFDILDQDFLTLTSAFSIIACRSQVGRNLFHLFKLSVRSRNQGSRVAHSTDVPPGIKELFRQDSESQKPDRWDHYAEGLTKADGDPSYIVRDIYRSENGWWDRNPTSLHPAAPDAAAAEADVPGRVAPARRDEQGEDLAQRCQGKRAQCGQAGRNRQAHLRREHRDGDEPGADQRDQHAEPAEEAVPRGGRAAGVRRAELAAIARDIGAVGVVADEGEDEREHAGGERGPVEGADLAEVETGTGPAVLTRAARSAVLGRWVATLLAVTRLLAVAALLAPRLAGRALRLLAGTAAEDAGEEAAALGLGRLGRVAIVVLTSELEALNPTPAGLQRAGALLRGHG